VAMADFSRKELLPSKRAAFLLREIGQLSTNSLVRMGPFEEDEQE